MSEWFTLREQDEEGKPPAALRVFADDAGVEVFTCLQEYGTTASLTLSRDEALELADLIHRLYPLDAMSRIR